MSCKVARARQDAQRRGGREEKLTVSYDFRRLKLVELG